MSAMAVLTLTRFEVFQLLGGVFPVLSGQAGENFAGGLAFGAVAHEADATHDFFSAGFVCLCPDRRTQQAAQHQGRDPAPQFVLMHAQPRMNDQKQRRKSDDCGAVSKEHQPSVSAQMLRAQDSA